VRDQCGVHCLIQEALIQPLPRLTCPFPRGLQDRPVLIQSEVHIIVGITRLLPRLLDRPRTLVLLLDALFDNLLRLKVGPGRLELELPCLKISLVPLEFCVEFHTVLEF
jgi:hypothetical protein